MNTKIIRTLLKKEMLDVFRDKKTVIMMLVVPVLLYPIVFIGALQVMAFINSSMKDQEYRIAVETDDKGAFLDWMMQSGEQDPEEGEATYRITAVDAAAAGIGEGVWETALEAEEIDAYVSVYDSGGRMQYDVYYLSSVTNSSYAADLVMDILDEFREDLTRHRIAEEGLEAEEILEPILYERKNTASSEQSLGSIIGSVLPLMLVISLLMGTMYPAIDTTAGERERGTLETLLTLPIMNRDLIMAKFLTVAVIGMVSALLNILSMGGIAVYMYKIMDLQTEIEDIDLMRFITAILVCILAVFAFSLFVSAVTMCATSFAKSYKEANNYITPLMLVMMFTGYIGFIPNLELTQGIAMIPVANICLLIRNMMVFRIDYAMTAVVLLSNVAYAVLAILFLSRIYDSESVLFSDGKGGLQLFERRENLTKGGVPTVSDAMFVMAVTLLLLMYAGSILQLRYGLAGLFMTQMLLLAAPLCLVIYTRRDIRETYGFAGAKLQAYLGSAILGVGLFLVNLVIAAGMLRLFPNSAENIETAFSTVMGDNMAAALFVIALTPAVCEEMLFRGVVFHAIKARHHAAAACTVTAVLFGCFHMSLVKLIPTGLLGLVLCLVVWQTGSIYPAMLMHFMNNALSVVISFCPEQIGKVFPVLYKSSFSPAEGLMLMGAGAVFAGIGAAILRRRSDTRLVL